MRTMPTRLYALLAGIAALVLSFAAAAEPPLRAARLATLSGTVSFSPAGQSDWVRAHVNRPLTTGDRLWVDAGSRAELQVGGAAIRLGPRTSVSLLNVDDRIVQLEVTEGTLNLRVRRVGPNETFEIDTPNLAFVTSRAGEYRIDADADDDATAVSVRSGSGNVYGGRASYALKAAQGYRFYGASLSDYDRLPPPREDELDRWSHERDRIAAASRSARYVSPDVVGYEDLDAYGAWRTDPEYGNVWAPSRVAAGWTPYRDGHWAWVDPWGWTWVDDAPWGYAVSHYGRWANVRGAWVWVPGPAKERAVYAPAQVAFVGGKDFQAAATVGAVVAALVGWFPLAPREVYRPSYQVSRNYFDRVNRSNSAVAPAAITNVYNTTIVNNNTTIVNRPGAASGPAYANQRVAGAVVAVPAQAFVQAQPVAKASVPVSKEAAAGAHAAPVAPVAPAQQSVHGGAPAAGAAPVRRERPIVARTAPPAPRAAPVEDAQRKQLQPAPAPAPAPAAKVSVVAAPAAPTAPPPATAPAGRSPEERRAESARGGRGEGRRGEAQRADAPKADAAKADAQKADAQKADASRAEAAKAEAARADAAKAEAARGEKARSDSARADAAKAEAARADAAKAAAAKADAAKAAAAKADASRAEAAKAEAARADAAKAEAARGEKARSDSARADAAKAEAAKAEAARADAAKTAAAKAEAARADAAKADAAKAAAARAEAARAEAAKQAAAKAATANVEAGAKAEAPKGRPDRRNEAQRDEDRRKGDDEGRRR